MSFIPLSKIDILRFLRLFSMGITTCKAVGIILFDRFLSTTALYTKPALYKRFTQVHYDVICVIFLTYLRADKKIVEN